MEFVQLLGDPPVFRFKKGDLLFLQGSPCEGIYYMIEGTAKLYTLNRDGKETIHHLVLAGEFAGVSGLLGHKYHSCSAKAMENIQCCYLSREELLRKFFSDSRITGALFQKLGILLDHILERQSRYARFGVKRKMASCLNELAENFGESSTEGIRIKLQISREEFASLLGVAPETAIRFISEFKREGLITEKNRHLIIKDPQTIKQLSSE